MRLPFACFNSSFFRWWIIGSFFIISCDNNEVIPSPDDPSGVLANGGLKGTGSFVYKDYKPLSDKPLTVYYHVPESATPTSRILMVFHGAGRNAEEYREGILAKADRYGTILVVPEFSATYYPGGDAYNLGNVFEDGDRPSPSTLNQEAEWTFSVVEPLFDFMKKLTANQSATYDVFGFSAGAQFAHRLLLLKPKARIGQMVAGSAGWYTMPDFEVDFPYGLKESPAMADNMPGVFAADVTVLVGEKDNDPNASSLRRNKQADVQGTNRYDRAVYFFEESKEIANRLGTSFKWQYIALPRVAHDFVPAAAYAMDNVFNK